MPRRVLLLWVVVMLISGAWLTRTPLNFDLSGFLPGNASAAQRLLLDQLRDGMSGRLILLAVRGDSTEQRARISQQLANQLQQSGQFGLVANGTPPSPAQLEWLMARRYLLSPTLSASTFSTDGLRDALDENLQLLGSPAGAAIKAWLPRDPSGEMRTLLLSLMGAQPPESQHGVWFSRDRGEALLLAYSLAPGLDAQAQQRAIETIYRAFDAARAPSDASLVLSGPAVFAVASRTKIEQAAHQLTLISTLLVMLILCWAYRAWRPVLYSLIPLVSGLVIGAAAVGALFGSIHGITLAFGAMLIGEAIDYPAYLYTQRRDDEALDVTAQRIRRAMWLAMLTTALGALAMLLADLDGLRQLGVFTAVGALAAGLTTRSVLPLFNPGPYRLPQLLTRWPRPPRWLPLLLLVASLVVLARAGVIWDDDLSQLSPITKDALTLDRHLRGELGAPDVRYLLTFSADSREGALALSEQFQPWLQQRVADTTIQGYALAAQLLPSQSAQRARQAALPDADTAAQNLQQAMRGLPFKPDTFAPFLRELAEARTQPAIERRDLDGTIWASRVDALLMKSNQQWLALAPLSGVNAPQRLRADIEQRAVAGVALLDIKGDTEHVLRNAREQSLWLVGAGMLVIAALLTWSLGGWRAALPTMAPVVASMCMTAAALVAVGARLNLFHLISLLLVLGIGLNYALFFRRLGNESPATSTPTGDQDDASRDDTRRASMAVGVCAMTSLSAFACLALSAIPVLHAIGITVLLGTIFSLINVAAWRDQ